MKWIFAFGNALRVFVFIKEAAKFWLYIPEKRKESICNDQSQMSLIIRKWIKRGELLGEALLNAIRLAVREEIREALIQGGFSFDDRLLNTEEASKGAAGFAGLFFTQLPQIAVHTETGAERYAFPIEKSRPGFGGISASSLQNGILNAVPLSLTTKSVLYLRRQHPATKDFPFCSAKWS